MSGHIGGTAAECKRAAGRRLDRRPARAYASDHGRREPLGPDARRGRDRGGLRARPADPGFRLRHAAPAVAGFAAICAPAGAAGDDSRHPQDRPDANACCLLACPSKGPAAGGPTEAAARPAPPLRAATKAAFPEADAEALPPPVLRPFDARGPPSSPDRSPFRSAQRILSMLSIIARGALGAAACLAAAGSALAHVTLERRRLRRARLQGRRPRAATAATGSRRRPCASRSRPGCST